MASIVREGDKKNTWVASYWHPYEGGKTEVVEAESYEDARWKAKEKERLLYKSFGFPWKSWWA